MDSRLLALTLWQRLEDWDERLFIRLNSRWTNPFFDAVLPYIRNSVVWAPFYLFLLVFVTLNFGLRGLWWCLFFVCTVAFTDVVGARVFKEGFQRLRPCNDPALMDHVRLLLKHCSDSYSFVSNHAANHFGIATFMLLTFRGVFRNWAYLIYAWALVIAYAQVYVGVHYPLDALGGAGLGVLAGNLAAWLFHKRFGRLNLDIQSK